MAYVCGLKRYTRSFAVTLRRTIYVRHCLIVYTHNINFGCTCMTYPPLHAPTTFSLAFALQRSTKQLISCLNHPRCSHLPQQALSASYTTCIQLPLGPSSKRTRLHVLQYGSSRGIGKVAYHAESSSRMLLDIWLQEQWDLKQKRKS